MKKSCQSLQNIFLLTFLLTLFSILITVQDSNASMFNRFKKGFYFEKYKNADEAKEALLKLHPVGSDVRELVKTLERAGGECKIYTTKNGLGANKLSKADDFYNCGYSRGIFPFSSVWMININVEENNLNLIKEIYVVSGVK